MTKLLVVDDNEQNRYLLQALLIRHGYDVIVAADGGEALEKARDNPPDMIITDILMPGMDGYALCRQWKRDEKLNEIPFVFCTATYTDPKDEQIALSMGAARFIRKPQEQQALLDMIEEVIEEHKAGRLTPSREPVLEETVYLKEYNEALIRKLEGKLVELESANASLEREVTERKRTEEALIASEIRYHRLFESALDGMLILDADTGAIIDANSFLIELLGFSREQILGKKVWELGFVKDVIANQDNFLELQQKEYVRYENLPLETADGRQIAVEFISTVYLVGQTKLVQCSIRDLTERREAAEVLFLNKARLEVLLGLHEKMNAPRQEILDFCLEGALKTAQSGFSFVGMMDEEESTLTVHAWSKETMRECAIDDTPLRFPIGGAGLWADCVRQRKAVIINDYDAPLPGKIGCPDGHVKLKRLLCVPVFDGTRIIAVAAAANKKDPYNQEDVAALTALMSKMWEILRYKRAEEQARHTLEGLESSNKELEQFAYVASHDLQEPLRMVSSYMQLLAERYEPQLDDKARKFIHYAVDGAVRMQRLINDLLAYSRVATRGTVFAPVDSHAALGGAIANLQLAIDEAGPVITNDDLPEVRADSSQLTQVFQNLIGNAIKFHGPETPHIHVSAKTRGETAEFSVRDNGIGIDQKYKDQVFMIFQRLHTMSEYPGTGIGLALCKRIIEHHGGKIWFESEPGKGAVFYFTLPTTKKEIK
jgi:PAS domain S-box-containing protein